MSVVKLVRSAAKLLQKVDPELYWNSIPYELGNALEGLSDTEEALNKVLSCLSVLDIEPYKKELCPKCARERNHKNNICVTCGSRVKMYRTPEFHI